MRRLQEEIVDRPMSRKTRLKLLSIIKVSRITILLQDIEKLGSRRAAFLGTAAHFNKHGRLSFLEKAAGALYYGEFMPFNVALYESDLIGDIKKQRVE